MDCVAAKQTMWCGLRLWLRAILLLVIALAGIFATRVSFGQSDIDIGSSDCGSLPNGKQWPSAPSGPPALKQRDSADGQKDRSTASSFEVWRDFQSGGKAQLYVCYANVRVEPSTAANQIHLLITLPKELPKGKTVGDYVKELEVSSSEAKIFIKVPKKLRASVLLQVPAQTSFEAGLGRGEIDFKGIVGDKEIGVGFGTVSVHMLPDEYAMISAGIAFGGVKDERSGGKSHRRIAGGFDEKGKGKYKLEVGMGFGHLILLPGQ